MTDDSAEAEFSRFVVAHQRRLQRTAWLLSGGDWAAAEDLVQHALAQTWLHWERIRRRDAPQVYACRVIVTAHADRWRRRWRGEVPHAVLPEGPNGAAPAQEPDLAERRAVLDALHRLPLRQRQVLVLRYFVDLTEVEAARALGIAVGTVKSTASAGLQRLREDPGLALDDEEVAR